MRRRRYTWRRYTQEGPDTFIAAPPHQPYGTTMDSSIEGGAPCSGQGGDKRHTCRQVWVLLDAKSCHEAQVHSTRSKATRKAVSSRLRVHASLSHTIKHLPVWKEVEEGWAVQSLVGDSMATWSQTTAVTSSLTTHIHRQMLIFSHNDLSWLS